MTRAWTGRAMAMGLIGLFSAGCTEGGIEPDSIDAAPELADPALEFLVQPEQAKQAEQPRGPSEPLPAPEPSDLMDAYNPNVLELFGDRETGVAAVLRSYESASCMSGTQTYSGVTRLPESAFDAIELRRELPIEPKGYY